MNTKLEKAETFLYLKLKAELILYTHRSFGE
jgi:hypothetical protein